MELCKKKRASAIVLVVVMIAIISILSLGWWKRASMHYDIVCTREEWYKNFYLAELLLHVGIDLVKERFTELAARERKAITYDLSDIARKYAGEQVRAVLLVRKVSERQALHLRVKCRGCRVDCFLKKEGELEGFTVSANRESDNKKL